MTTSTSTSTSIPSTMRAYQFTTTSPTLERNLTLNPRAPLPPTATSLAPSTVLVKVLAASLNAFDFKLPELRYLGRLAVGRPSVPCMDFAGRVVALGKETGLEVGDLVYGRLDGPTKFGTLAEYTVVPRAGCAKLPEGVSVVDGAAAGSVSLTAYQAIVPKLGGIGGGVGKKIFINGGSGGTGTFGIQIAKAMGCEVVTSCSTGNVGLCESLGADVVVDYKTQDVLAEVKRISGFDLVVDFVGTPGGLYWEGPAFMKEGAPFVQVGNEGITVGFVAGMLFKTVWPGWLGGGKRPWEFLGLVSKSEDYEVIGRWVQEGKVKVVVDEIFEFEEKGPVKAFEKLRTGRARGKIVVKVADQ